MQISENTKIRFSVFIVMIGALASSFVWVGAIQADVTTLKNEKVEISKKLDSIKENVDYIKGRIDQERNHK